MILGQAETLEDSEDYFFFSDLLVLLISYWFI